MGKIWGCKLAMIGNHPRGPLCLLVRVMVSFLSFLCYVRVFGQNPTNSYKFNGQNIFGQKQEMESGHIDGLRPSGLPQKLGNAQIQIQRGFKHFKPPLPPIFRRIWSLTFLPNVTILWHPGGFRCMGAFRTWWENPSCATFWFRNRRGKQCAT